MCRLLFFAVLMMFIGACGEEDLSLHTGVSGLSSGVLYPSGAGFYTKFTPVPSDKANFKNVKEIGTCDGVTSYNHTNTLGHRDSYLISYSSIPERAKLNEVKITPCAARNSGTAGGSSTMNVFIRLNGVDLSPQGNYSLTSIVPLVLSPISFFPSQTYWLPGTTLEVGAEYTAGDRGVRFSQFKVTLYYTNNPPLEPVGLEASLGTTGTFMGPQEINLQWSDVASNETGFLIERSRDGVNFQQIALTSIPNLGFYEDAAISSPLLDEALPYYYQVRSVNNGGASWPTNIVQVNGLSPPTGLAALHLGGNAMRLEWKDNSNLEDGYLIERLDEAHGWQPAGFVGTDSESLDYPNAGPPGSPGALWHVRALRDNYPRDSDLSVTSNDVNY